VKALDDAVANAGRELEALRLKDADAQRRIDQVKSEASAALASQREAQRSLDDERAAAVLLRGEMERLLADYKHLKGDHEIARGALHRAQAAAGESETGAAIAATALNELRAEVSRLTHSKQMLQKAMLEQLSHARRELREEQGHRRAADAENASLRTKLREANMENATIEAAISTISEVEGLPQRRMQVTREQGQSARPTSTAGRGDEEAAFGKARASLATTSELPPPTSTQRIGELPYQPAASRVEGNDSPTSRLSAARSASAAASARVASLELATENEVRSSSSSLLAATADQKVHENTHAKVHAHARDTEATRDTDAAAAAVGFSLAELAAM
jgi:hypothetical protein